MKRIIKAITIIITLLYAIGTRAQDIIYENADSLFIENIITRHPAERYATTGDRIIAIAKEFIGAEYVAGTLDNHSNEPLYISCNKLDCTTFVETVLAIATSPENSFSSVCNSLERIRYRNGIRNGYISRLHYISWWIDDSAKQKSIKEIDTELHTAQQQLNMNFMSTHPHSYKHLKEDRQGTQSIAIFEEPYRNVSIRYIPKMSISQITEENIKNGDIIAIVTSIEGLDVSHLGFAYWSGGQLHLIHASSKDGKVITDPKSLDTYLAERKNHSGIRIFRAF